MPTNPFLWLNLLQHVRRALKDGKDNRQHQRYYPQLGVGRNSLATSAMAFENQVH